METMQQDISEIRKKYSGTNAVVLGVTLSGILCRNNLHDRGDVWYLFFGGEIGPLELMLDTQPPISEGKKINACGAYHSEALPAEEYFVVDRLYN